jgi:hypothetical protein
LQGDRWHYFCKEKLARFLQGGTGIVFANASRARNIRNHVVGLIGMIFAGGELARFLQMQPMPEI